MTNDQGMRGIARRMYYASVATATIKLVLRLVRWYKYIEYCQ